MVEVSRLLSEAPIFGLVVCLAAVFSRDRDGEGVVPEPEPDGAAPVEPGPSEEEGATRASVRPGPQLLAAPASAVRALLTLVPFVMSLVRRCGIPERDVPDLTQEVVIALLPWCSCRSAGELAAPAVHLRGYVRVVTLHRAIRHRRRVAHRGEQLGWEPGHSGPGGQGAETAPGEAPSPEAWMLDLEDSREHTAELDLDRLSAATDAASWRAFYGHEVLGVPVRAIAEAEGVSAATIYTRLRVARRDLRASILRYRAARRNR